MMMERVLEEMMMVVVRRTQDEHVLSLLQETQVGKLVNGIRKHPASRVAALAQQITDAWKEAIIRAQKQKPKPTNHKTAQSEINAQDNEQRAPQKKMMSLKAPPSNGPKQQSHMRSCTSSTASYVERMEASKRRLQRAYEQEQAAKRQHTIRLLHPSQLPAAPLPRRPAPHHL
ncbi:hypothetical protein GOP47_0023005 [Adiantum capillus-veneris]|uniref:TFIIS N-terminal domain-containing protein n=1 Tax=Adiantum capillus-veneris TaxID=13818 RepID=A0A9D4U6I4_ADICA|nr:hypothetical protein GOP47_0023005 [Adiantum capillus-veneris]